MSLSVLPTLLAVIVLCALNLFVVLRRPPAPMWPALPLNLFFSLLFAMGDLLSEFVQNPQYNWWALSVLYTGIIFLPSLWWLLAIRFAQAYGHSFSLDARFWAAGPLVIATVLWVAMLTNTWHGQFLTQIVGSRNEYHWLWWVHASFGYLLVLAVLSLYSVLLGRVKSSQQRTRIWVMIGATSLNILANLAYVLSPEPLPFDPTAAVYSFSGILFLIAIYRGEFFSLSSVAIAFGLLLQRDSCVTR